MLSHYLRTCELLFIFVGSNGLELLLLFWVSIIEKIVLFATTVVIYAYIIAIQIIHNSAIIRVILVNIYDALVFGHGFF